jgi:hypothetical protein
MKPLRSVIFLDIDGVLQPLSSQQRFRHDLKALQEQLAFQYQNDDYREMDRYDLGAVYYDWDKEAVERLRTLCVDVPADIVITSDWRNYSPLSRENSRKHLRLISGTFQTTKMAFQTRFKPNFGIYAKSFPAIRAFSKKGFR